MQDGASLSFSLELEEGLIRAVDPDEPDDIKETMEKLVVHDGSVEEVFVTA